MAKSFKARYLAALKARDKAMSAVYAAAYPRRDVVFWECLAIASPDVREAYESAFSALYMLDREAESSGRAYQARAAALADYRPESR